MVAPFYPKARKRSQGIRQWQTQLANFKPNNTIWMHCASLGEFEQGRPLLDALAKRNPEQSILLTFFSPSGYEVRKHYGQVSQVIYLPDDTPENAKQLLDIIQPQLVIFVKYDFWFHYLHEVRKRNITSVLIAAKFHHKQVYFHPLLRSFYASIFSSFTCIFTQDDASWTFLDTLKLPHVQIKKAGDPRFDRVLEQVQKPAPLPDLSEFLQGQFCCIAGSTWPLDDDLIIQTIQVLKDHAIRWIIAPHEFNETVWNRYRKHFKHEILLFSNMTQWHPGHKILMIDKVGYLSSLYGQSNIAYIGGGQHHRIHNIQEPAAHGIPICFGPKYHAFKEAEDIVHAGGAKVITDAKSLIDYITDMKLNTEKSASIGNMNQNYILSKAGATGRILSILDTAKYI